MPCSSELPHWQNHPISVGTIPTVPESSDHSAALARRPAPRLRLRRQTLTVLLLPRIYLVLHSLTSALQASGEAASLAICLQPSTKSEKLPPSSRFLRHHSETFLLFF